MMLEEIPMSDDLDLEIQKYRQKLEKAERKKGVLDFIKASFENEDGTLSLETISSVVDHQGSKVKIRVSVSEYQEPKTSKKPNVKKGKSKRTNQTKIECPDEVFQAFKSSMRKIKSSKKATGKKGVFLEMLTSMVEGFQVEMWDSFKARAQDAKLLKSEGKGAGTTWSIK